jgi:hypothetical protein
MENTMNSKFLDIFKDLVIQLEYVLNDEIGNNNGTRLNQLLDNSREFLKDRFNPDSIKKMQSNNMEKYVPSPITLFMIPHNNTVISSFPSDIIVGFARLESIECNENKKPRLTSEINIDIAGCDLGTLSLGANAGSFSYAYRNKFVIPALCMVLRNTNATIPFSDDKIGILYAEINCIELRRALGKRSAYCVETVDSDTSLLQITSFINSVPNIKKVCKVSSNYVPDFENAPDIIEFPDMRALEKSI